MTALHPAFESIKKCVRLLFLDSDSDIAPFGLYGSCILAKHGPTCMVVTAGHLVHRNHSGQLRVLPTDKSKKRLPLSQGFSLKPYPDGTEVDISVFPAALNVLSRRELERSAFVQLDGGHAVDWLATASVARFYVVGYPRDLAEAHYDEHSWTMEQVLLPAGYAGSDSGAPNMHVLRVHDSMGLDQFAGLSGGAVFSFEKRIGAAAICRFCGVVVQGTPLSGLIRFVDAAQVLEVVRSAERYLSMYGLKLGKRVMKFQVP